MRTVSDIIENKKLKKQLNKMNIVIAEVCIDDVEELWEVKKYLVYNVNKLEKILEKEYMDYEIIFKTTFREINIIPVIDTERTWNKHKFYLI